MDDPRIEWLRDKAYVALNIKESTIFEDLLDRDDGEPERMMLKFLNETPEDQEDSLVFYKTLEEEEEEVEVEVGTSDDDFWVATPPSVLDVLSAVAN